MNVQSPFVVLQGIGHCPCLPAALGDVGIEERGYLANGAPADPAIILEFSNEAIPDSHGSGRKEGAFLVGALQFHGMPGMLVVSATEPEPVDPEGEGRSLQVADAKATKGKGACDALPVYMAVAAIGFFAPCPEETSLYFLNWLEGLPPCRKNKQLVYGDCSQDRFDDGEPS